MNRLPGFHLREYRALLKALRDAGYLLSPVSEMVRQAETKTLYLRHDVDFFATAILPMAEMEADLGLSATYYFLLTGPYDLYATDNREALRHIVELGHEIGLHYDLTTYPTEEMDAHLARERTALEDLSCTSVNTLTMHQPHQGDPDPFRELDSMIHPHDPRLAEGLTYISDSCRAWRDETLLDCFGRNPPFRVLLLTHPELWLDGSITNREAYLEEVIVTRSAEEHKAYFQHEVSRIWKEHAGVRAHDLREEQALSPTTQWVDRSWAEDHMSEFLAHFAAFPEVPWGADAIVAERPDKWDLSLALTFGGEIVSFSFNSRKDDSLYFHAFYVAETARGTGLGVKMLEELNARALSRGLSCLRLAVHQTNTDAQAFYLAQGFTEVMRDEDLNQLQLERPVS